VDCSNDRSRSPGSSSPRANGRRSWARFHPGERIVLRSLPPQLGTDFFNDRFSGGDDTLDLLEWRAAAKLRPAPELPAGLTEPGRAAPEAVTRTRRFELSGSRRIDGQTMDMTRVDEVVPLGRTEIWDVRNEGTPMPTPRTCSIATSCSTKTAE
jgi:FtsP/CotA-like multicopper oxidase with cupredoxin domain